MPAPAPDVIASTNSPIRIALEPAHHALHSLMLLYKAEKLSGLDEWVTRTAAALTPEQRRKNDLVTFDHLARPGFQRLQPGVQER
jgi:hypothetical protein